MTARGESVARSALGSQRGRLLRGPAAHRSAADDQHPVSAWADGVELRVHAFADGAEHTVVIPSTDGPGETAGLHPRRRGGSLHVTTDSPHPCQLRISGPNATVHTRPAGTSEADLPYPA